MSFGKFFSRVSFDSTSCKLCRRYYLFRFQRWFNLRQLNTLFVECLCHFEYNRLFLQQLLYLFLRHGQSEVIDGMIVEVEIKQFIFILLQSHNWVSLCLIACISHSSTKICSNLTRRETNRQKLPKSVIMEIYLSPFHLLCLYTTWESTLSQNFLWN